jgi:hypothetical protein
VAGLLQPASKHLKLVLSANRARCGGSRGFHDLRVQQQLSPGRDLSRSGATISPRLSDFPARRSAAHLINSSGSAPLPNTLRNGTEAP